MVTEVEISRSKGHDVTDELRERGPDGLQEVLRDNSEPYQPADDGVVGEQASVGRPLPELRCMADIESKEVDWLWVLRIPLGHITLLEGDHPGEGKSMLSLALAAAHSLGAALPGDGASLPKSSSVLLTAEDHLETTVRPRLDAMGADASMVHAVDEAFPLDSAGIQHLDQLVESRSARLIVIDPIVAFLPAELDLHRANEVRTVMASLSDMAERRHCAVLILRHLTKGQGGKAIYRGLGSIDFTAAARSVLMAGHDPDDRNSRALAHIKSNLGPLADTIGYSIDDGQFLWTGDTELTAGQMLAAESDASSLGEAKTFLRELLAEGAVPQRDAQDAATASDISIGTLKRAKKALGVKARREGGTKRCWVWELPADDV